MVEQTEKMDRMYRYQRHFYDFSRKYYLIGRDRLLHRMNVKPEDRVLEIACGTARNLFMLARMRTDAQLYGIDASLEMLKTASEKIDANPAYQRIELKQDLAEQVSFNGTFGLNRRFDIVFCSYGLSMIPTWREAIANALQNLKPGGSFFIVDFWDQRDLPAVFRAMLVRWLDLFDVKFRPDLIAHLHALAAAGAGTLDIESVGYRYSYIAEFRKTSDVRVFEASMAQQNACALS